MPMPHASVPSFETDGASPTFALASEASCRHFRSHPIDILGPPRHRSAASFEIGDILAALCCSSLKVPIGWPNCTRVLEVFGVVSKDCTLGQAFRQQTDARPFERLFQNAKAIVDGTERGVGTDTHALNVRLATPLCRRFSLLAGRDRGPHRREQRDTVLSPGLAARSAATMMRSPCRRPRRRLLAVELVSPIQPLCLERIFSLGVGGAPSSTARVAIAFASAISSAPFSFFWRVTSGEQPGGSSRQRRRQRAGDAAACSRPPHIPRVIYPKLCLRTLPE